MTTELITEIDSLIALMEAGLPVSINHPANLKLEKALKDSLGLYFQVLDKAFPYYLLDKIYYLNVTEALPTLPVTGDNWDWLNNLLSAFQTDLLARVSGHLAGIYLAGNMQMMSWGYTKGGFPKLYEGPPISQAVEWANNYCAQLVTGLDQETKNQLAQIISDGIQDKRGVEGISRDIRQQFTDMSKTRADIIAQTESNDALSQGAMQRMQDMGVEGKEWIAADDEPCEDCQANADQGVIPIDQPFQSGDMQPSAHPRCRCAISPALLPEQD